jgi:hypothetical protein
VGAAERSDGERSETECNGAAPTAGYSACPTSAGVQCEHIILEKGARLMRIQRILRHFVARLAIGLLVVFTLQAQTNRFSCPAYGGGYLPIIWSAMYAAYIPADHIQGPPTLVSSCSHPTLGSSSYIYKGDGNADIGDGWPVQSARIYGNVQFYGSFNNGVQNFPAYQSPFWADTGQTRNYAWGSPANGSTLSSADEDGIQADCFRWHNAGFGDKSDMHAELTTSGSTQQNGNLRFYGTGANPLESMNAKIAWDIRVLMNGNDPTDARVTNINYNHTCFPAHIIKTQRFTVYYYGPPRSDPTYVFGCLYLQQGKIIGQTQPNKKVPCD